MANTTKRLHILWTTGDTVSSEKMVLMYALNARKRGWWDEITVIIWGASALLVAEHAQIRGGVRDLLEAGVHVSACKACADQLEVTATLEAAGVEMKYWGEGLTELLEQDAKLLTV
jgi:hypothetical protein